MSFRSNSGGDTEIPIVWFENQRYDIGARVSIVLPAAQAEAGAEAGNVVGYDASGPRPGESFIRVLVQPDTPTPSIIALPPDALRPEAVSDRVGLARAIMVGLEQQLPAEQFSHVQTWLRSEACAAICANPDTRRQRIRLGSLRLPGLVLPELAQLAAEA
jgi:hypothetical protein